MEKKTIEDEKGVWEEYQYFISSLKLEEETFRRAVRGHWSVECTQWYLAVTFREDVNRTLDKQAAQNLNIVRKWSLSLLKMIEISKTGLSMKKKRFVISLRPIQYLEEVLSFLKMRMCCLVGKKHSCVWRDTRAVVLDLSKYFDTLNHTILMRKQVKDERAIHMAKRYLKSGVMENDVITETEEGSPQ